MTGEIFDPTFSSVEEKFSFAARPQNLEGLKIGIVENTKYNSDILLLKIAELLVKKFQIMVYIGECLPDNYGRFINEKKRFFRTLMLFAAVPFHSVYKFLKGLVILKFRAG